MSVCVGFEEILDITLSYNQGHFDTVIVVTTIQDTATHKVANKHGVVPGRWQAASDDGLGCHRVNCFWSIAVFAGHDGVWLFRTNAMREAWSGKR